MLYFFTWENSKTVSILDNENYWFILNTCRDTVKQADTRVGFLVIFSRLRWPIEPKFSQGLLFDIEVVIHEVWALGNTVYQKGPVALKAVYTIGYYSK